jgi:hypothetical protein
MNIELIFVFGIFMILILCIMCSGQHQKISLNDTDDTDVGYSRKKTNTNTTHKVSKDKTQIKIVSCGCSVVTWHPGVIEHKMKCPIFRERNPGLSVKDFLAYEGFPIDNDREWPAVDPKVVPEKE